MYKRMKRKPYISIGMLAIGVALFSLAFNRPISSVSNDSAVKVIVGEAADQGLKGMIAVGEVIRNRGDIKGFSVTEKDLEKFVAEQPESILKSAERAWFLSYFTDITNGADHFDNIKKFGMPDWTKDMEKVATVGDMQYFKDNK